MDKYVNESESRRKFLKTAGKFAVYTPPVLMLMSKSSPEAFAKSCNQGIGLPVVNDGCQPGKSGLVLNNDDFPGAGPGYPGASN